MRLSKVPKRFRHIRFFAVAQNDRETTCAHGECHSWRRTGIACADVKGAGRQAGGGKAERKSGQGCLVVTKLHPARNRQESKIKRFYGQY